MQYHTPHFICDFCGETYGKKEPPEFSNWHLGKCDVCQDDQVMVTTVQNFGGLYDTWKDSD